jgi:Domain of unknown function (DUF2437)
MKLVTFDEGRTGRIEGDTVVELNCGSTREYFERGGVVGETGERLPLASVRLRALIVPKKFFHTAGNFTERREMQSGVFSAVGQLARHPPGHVLQPAGVHGPGHVLVAAGARRRHQVAQHGPR